MFLILINITEIIFSQTRNFIGNRQWKLYVNIFLSSGVLKRIRYRNRDPLVEKWVHCISDAFFSHAKKRGSRMRAKQVDIWGGLAISLVRALVSGNEEHAWLRKQSTGCRNVFNIKGSRGRDTQRATRRAWARKSIPIYFVGPRARSRTTFLSTSGAGQPTDKLRCPRTRWIGTVVKRWKPKRALGSADCEKQRLRRLRKRATYFPYFSDLFRIFFSSVCRSLEFISTVEVVCYSFASRMANFLLSGVQNFILF